MGKFGCTQIRTSSSCSSERKKDFDNLFFSGSEYFAQRFNRPVEENGQKSLTNILTPRGTFLAKKGGYSWELAGVFG